MNVKLVLIQTLFLFNSALQTLIWVRVIMSFPFVRPRAWSRDTQWFFRLEGLVERLTEPILAPVRRVLPTAGMLDFSPLVASLLLGILTRVLADLIRALPL